MNGNQAPSPNGSNSPMPNVNSPSPTATAKSPKKTWCEQWAEFKLHWHIVYEHLKDKAIDGVCFGLGILVLTFFPPFEKLAAELTALFLTIPFIVAAGGVLSMLAYTAVAEDVAGKFLHRVARTWFDLVQQFFCIALGAYLPVWLAGLLKGSSNINSPGKEAIHVLLSLGAYALLSLLCGGAWALRDQRKEALPTLVQTLVIGVIFIAGIAILSAVQFLGVENGLGQNFLEFLFKYY